MQIFNFKRMLGLLAIGGGVAYVRKQGGITNAMESLKKLVSGLGDKAEPKAVGAGGNSGSGYQSARAPSSSVTPRY